MCIRDRLWAGLPPALSVEPEEDAVAPVEPPAEGIAGIWAALRAAQPASQQEARIVTTTDARLPSGYICWPHPSNWNASRVDKKEPSQRATKWSGINEM